MASFIEAHEPAIRLGAFLGVLLTMALLEVRFPRRRERTLERRRRWPPIVALSALDTLLLRLVFPAAAAGAALHAQSRGWGWLNQVEYGAWIEGVIAFVLMDLVVWGTHVLMHAVPALWRVHRVHHADLDFDTLTGIRFHPIEILLSMAIKFAAIFALGPPVVAIIVFEVVLNGAALFNHADVRLPPRLDRVLRLLLVTPDMHRVHHSTDREEHNRNFGFCLPWWDRLFRLYRAQPKAGHAAMPIGLDNHRDPKRVVAFLGLLRMPFGR